MSMGESLGQTAQLNSYSAIPHVLSERGAEDAARNTEIAEDYSYRHYS